MHNALYSVVHYKFNKKKSSSPIPAPTVPRPTHCIILTSSMFYQHLQSIKVIGADVLKSNPIGYYNIHGKWHISNFNNLSS